MGLNWFSSVNRVPISKLNWPFWIEILCDFQVGKFCRANTILATSFLGGFIIGLASWIWKSGPLYYTNIKYDVHFRFHNELYTFSNFRKKELTCLNFSLFTVWKLTSRFYANNTKLLTCLIYKIWKVCWKIFLTDYIPVAVINAIYLLSYLQVFIFEITSQSKSISSFQHDLLANNLKWSSHCL